MVNMVASYNNLELFFARGKSSRGRTNKYCSCDDAESHSKNILKILRIFWLLTGIM